MIYAWWNKSPLDEAITSLEALGTPGAKIISRHLYLVRGALLVFWKSSRNTFDLLQKHFEGVKGTKKNSDGTYPYLPDEEVYEVFTSYISLITLISRELHFIEKRVEARSKEPLLKTELMRKRYRIRFYRNKLEHWDDYAAISPCVEVWPSLGFAYVTAGGPNGPGDVKKNYSKLIKLFKKYGVPNPKFTGDAADGSFVDASYTDWVYSCLEHLDPQLAQKIPDEIVRHLFLTGIPLPIVDFQTCLSEFATAIRDIAAV